MLQAWFRIDTNGLTHNIGTPINDCKTLEKIELWKTVEYYNMEAVTICFNNYYCYMIPENDARRLYEALHVILREDI